MQPQKGLLKAQFWGHHLKTVQLAQQKKGPLRPPAACGTGSLHLFVWPFLFASFQSFQSENIKKNPRNVDVSDYHQSHQFWPLKTCFVFLLPTGCTSSVWMSSCHSCWYNQSIDAIPLATWKCCAVVVKTERGLKCSIKYSSFMNH